jgi:hypothetical protein
MEENKILLEQIKTLKGFLIEIMLHKENLNY